MKENWLIFILAPIACGLFMVSVPLLGLVGASIIKSMSSLGFIKGILAGMFMVGFSIGLIGSIVCYFVWLR